MWDKRQVGWDECERRHQAITHALSRRQLNYSRAQRERGSSIYSELPHVFAAQLQVVRCQTSTLCYAGEHARSDFVSVMKCEYEIRPIVPREDPVRSCLALDRPAQS